MTPRDVLILLALAVACVAAMYYIHRMHQRRESREAEPAAISAKQLHEARSGLLKHLALAEDHEAEAAKLRRRIERLEANPYTPKP